MAFWHSSLQTGAPATPSVAQALAAASQRRSTEATPQHAAHFTAAVQGPCIAHSAAAQNGIALVATILHRTVIRGASPHSYRVLTSYLDGSAVAAAAPVGWLTTGKCLYRPQPPPPHLAPAANAAGRAVAEHIAALGLLATRARDTRGLFAEECQVGWELAVCNMPCDCSCDATSCCFACCSCCCCGRGQARHSVLLPS